MVLCANSELKRIQSTSFSPICADAVAGREELAVGGGGSKLQIIGVQDRLGAIDLQRYEDDIFQICYRADSERLYSCSGKGNESVQTIQIAGLENK